MSEHKFKYFCQCGCKAYAIPKTIPQEYIYNEIRKDARDDKDSKQIESYNPNDEFYHHKEPWELRVCSGTQPRVNDLAFPKDHYVFDVDKPCDFNAVIIRNRFDSTIIYAFILQGDCECTNKGLPVKPKKLNT
jgi:hypothetical protein